MYNNYTCAIDGVAAAVVVTVSGGRLWAEPVHGATPKILNKINHVMHMLDNCTKVESIGQKLMIKLTIALVKGTH